jgi:hypothetical protein
MKWQDLLSPLMIAGLIGVLLWKMPADGPAPAPLPAPAPGPRPRPAPPPVPETDPELDVEAPADPLAAAAKGYVAGFPAMLKALAADIHTGQITDKAAAVEFMKVRRNKFAAALDQAFASACDAEGNITDAAGLGKRLRAAGQAAGAR